MKTVLLVDDELGITDALGDVLRDEGFEVLTASNGQDGLERIEKQRPDVIVLDYMMPVMNGAEMLQALDAEPSLRGIPVILMSAAPPSSVSLERKPAALLRKPFKLEAFFTELDRVLGSAPG